MMLPFLLLALAFVIDACSLMLLVDVRLAMAAPVGVIGLHAIACTLAASAIPSLLPEPYQEMPFSGSLFLWMVAFFAPVLGMLGLSLALVPALWRQRAPLCRADWLYSNIGAGFDPAGTRPRSRQGSGDRCLIGVLRCAPMNHSRLRALISTLALDTQDAAPLLRIGLLDRDDDVRLLAYSLLTRKEKAIEERIGRSLRQLDKDSPEAVLAVHGALACDYWELALLGNASGASAFMLEQARKHVQAAIALDPGQASLHLLLGRILLKANELEPARVALLHAAARGVALEKVAPFLAEIAFQRGQFRQIGGLLSMGKSGQQVWQLRPVSAYWKEPYRAQ